MALTHSFDPEKVPAASSLFGNVLELVPLSSGCLLNFGFFSVPQGIQGHHGLGASGAVYMSQGQQICSTLITLPPHCSSLCQVRVSFLTVCSPAILCVVSILCCAEALPLTLSSFGCVHGEGEFSIF